MKTLLIINGIIACVVLILALEIACVSISTFKKDYPNAKLNKTSTFAKVISIIALVVKSLIPIYNIICLIGCLFMKDEMVENGYATLFDRIVEEDE